VAVVSVNAPGGQRAQGEVIFAGATDVVHDFLVAILLDGLADTPADVLQRRLPGDLLEVSLAALSDALQGSQDAFRIVHLIDRRRPLGAGAATAARMVRVSLKFRNLAGFLVDIRQ